MYVFVCVAICCVRARLDIRVLWSVAVVRCMICDMWLAYVQQQCKCNKCMQFKCEYLRHFALSVTQVLALVHGERASATTETVAFGAEFAAVALFAEEVTAVLGRVCAVQSLVAKAALEALLVPLGSGGEHLLSRVNGLAALRALGLLWHFERHFGLYLIVCLIAAAFAQRCVCVYL